MAAKKSILEDDLEEDDEEEEEEEEEEGEDRSPVKRIHREGEIHTECLFLRTT